MGYAMAFAGGTLERSAHLRSDPQAVAALFQSAGARVCLFWRGRPAFAPDGGLEWVEPGHPALADASEAPLFLGQQEGRGALFAAELTRFEPAGNHPDAKAFLDTSEQTHPALREGVVFAELRARMGALSSLDAEVAATARASFEWHRTHAFCSRCGQPSEPVQAGWVRKCPSCNGLHFPRTDPVVIMLVTRGNQVLLGRSPFWPEGMYSCLAGFMEPGETLEAAVRREVAEETGVRVGRVDYVASQPWPFPSSLMLGCRAEADSEAITIDPAEIEDAIWVSRERLMQIFAGADSVIRPPRQGAIAAWLMRGWLADSPV